MWGAIIGDLAGSIYEYDQFKSVKGVEMVSLIPDDAFFSDDTILTIAVLDAIMNGGDYDKYLREYASKYKNHMPNVFPYFKTVFSPGFTKWSEGDEVGHSTGNGAMMRISSVGYMFNSEDDVILNARLATIPSHNSDEAIDCATKVALIIYYLRCGMSLDEVFKKLSITPSYEPFEKFNTTCSSTIGNCLYALHDSNGFSDAIRRVLLMGGDTDTNACIVGSMAEALYGVDDNIIDVASRKIPDSFVKVLKKSNYR